MHMATRPVFIVSENAPFYGEFYTEFTWAPGFADSQKKKNIAAIHRCFTDVFPGKRALEISSKSTEPWGVNASAFF